MTGNNKPGDDMSTAQHTARTRIALALGLTRDGNTAPVYTRQAVRVPAALIAACHALDTLQTVTAAHSEVSYALTGGVDFDAPCYHESRAAYLACHTQCLSHGTTVENVQEYGIAA